MRQTKQTIYKDRVFSEIMLDTPDDIKTGHYEIGYSWDCKYPGALPESAEDFSIVCCVIYNIQSSRWKKEKSILLDEIKQRVEKDCNGQPGMMYCMNDFWDENGVREIKPIKHEPPCPTCGHSDDNDW